MGLQGGGRPARQSLGPEGQTAAGLWWRGQGWPRMATPRGLGSLLLLLLLLTSGEWLAPHPLLPRWANPSLLREGSRDRRKD